MTLRNLCKARRSSPPGSFCPHLPLPAPRPPQPFLLTIALDVAVGLQHVHSKGVVHGDVTASNVLLQALPSRPQGCVAKVAGECRTRQ